MRTELLRDMLEVIPLRIIARLPLFQCEYVPAVGVLQRHVYMTGAAW